jgi:type I restriction enzyme S subunit
MAGEWREVTVGEIASVERNALVGGPFGSNLVSQDYVERGVPVIRGQNMRDRWVGGEFAYVTPAKAESLGANIARPSDIVFTQRGTLGQVCLVPEGAFDRYLISQSQMKLTVDRAAADPLFFYYVFRCEQQQNYIRQHSIQTGVPHTNLGILRRTPVPLPPVQEQRAIAHILGTLDDKIELNQRTNETLEAIARALFKSWFVDFDPVRAKAEGRDPSLPKPLADLFPDCLEITDFYTAPAGWSILRWGELVTLEYGKSLEGYAGEEKPFPVYGTNGRIGSCAKPLCENAGIIIGRKGAYRGVHWCSEPFFVIDTAFFVAAKAPIELRWAYYELLRRDINSMDSGSAIPSTSRADFYGLEVLTPPIQVQQAFVRLLSPCWARQEQNAAESRTLAALRDTLLPKLISGELRIPVAEKLVDGAI